MSDSRTNKRRKRLSFSEIVKVSKIGDGGFGVVYQGRWGKKTVAIKEIFYEEDNDPNDEKPNSYKVCEKEKNILVELLNKGAVNVTKLLAYKDDPVRQVYTLIMDYTENSLDKLLGGDEPLSKQRQYCIIKTMINGLAFIHQNNIIHCDIKTSNVLVDAHGQVKICDFGLSVFNKEVNNIYCGSILWAAPEVLSRNHSNSPASDIYGLGLVMWCIAANVDEPYKNITTEQEAFDTITSGVKPEIPKNCSPLIYDLIKRCWDERSKRPTAHEANERVKGLSVDEESEMRIRVNL